MKVDPLLALKLAAETIGISLGILSLCLGLACLLLTVKVVVEILSIGLAIIGLCFGCLCLGLTFAEALVSR